MSAPLSSKQIAELRALLVGGTFSPAMKDRAKALEHRYATIAALDELITRRSQVNLGQALIRGLEIENAKFEAALGELVRLRDVMPPYMLMSWSKVRDIMEKEDRSVHDAAWAAARAALDAVQTGGGQQC